MASPTVRARRGGARRPGAAEGDATDRRQRVLTAGLAAFSARSYDEVLVSEVARAAGVAAGLPYHYFASKRGLYLAVLEYVAVELRDAYVVPAEFPRREAVRRLLRANLDWLATHQRILADLLHGGVGGDAEFSAAFEAARWDGARQLLDLVDYGEPSATARVVLSGWISMKDDVFLAWISDPVLPEDELIELSAQLFADVLDRVADATGTPRVDPALIR